MKTFTSSGSLDHEAGDEVVPFLAVLSSLTILRSTRGLLCEAGSTPERCWWEKPGSCHYWGLNQATAFFTLEGFTSDREITRAGAYYLHFGV